MHLSFIKALVILSKAEVRKLILTSINFSVLFIYSNSHKKLYGGPLFVSTIHKHWNKIEYVSYIIDSYSFI